MSVACSVFFPLATPCLYIYYTLWTKDAGVALPWTCEQIAIRQFVLLGVPEIIGVANWRTWLGDFRGGRLRVDSRAWADLSRPVIGQVSQTFLCALEQVWDPIGVRHMVMRDGAWHLLSLQTMIEVDWEWTFQGKAEMKTGCYLYYWETGRVDGLSEHPLGNGQRLVEPDFRAGGCTKLVECEREV